MLTVSTLLLKFIKFHKEYFSTGQAKIIPYTGPKSEIISMDIDGSCITKKDGVLSQSTTYEVSSQNIPNGRIPLGTPDDQGKYKFFQAPEGTSTNFQTIKKQVDKPLDYESICSVM